MSLFLQVNDIVRNEASVRAVAGISFSQATGEHLAVVGETGSGKSTLLRTIAGLLQPDEGTITFEGKRIKGPLEQLLPGHPRIAYLSQHFELRNHYQVSEVLQMVSAVTPDAAAHIYSICRISHLLERRTSQLSGGERQRIAIARLLTTLPSLMILDEPFSNLDLPHKLALQQVLADAGNSLGITFLLASHDPQDVMAWAQRILVLRRGQIVAQGAPDTIYKQPAGAYIAGLFGKYNLVMYGSQPVMLRPEDVVINPPPATAGTLTGEVTDVRFQGFYQELEIDISGQRLTAFSLHEKAYTAGNKVRIAIKRKLPVDMAWQDR